MKPYLNATNNSYSNAIRIYQINTKLCEALYPSLHTLEISLRNQINTVLSVKYDNDWFTNGKIQLEKYEQETINTAFKKCNNNLNNLVPELNFGFWNSLILKGFYQNTIWNPCSEKIFKYCPIAAPVATKLVVLVVRAIIVTALPETIPVTNEKILPQSEVHSIFTTLLSALAVDGKIVIVLITINKVARHSDIKRLAFWNIRSI
jgi:hypothetical protein